MTTRAPQARVMCLLCLNRADTGPRVTEAASRPGDSERRCRGHWAVRGRDTPDRWRWKLSKYPRTRSRITWPNFLPTSTINWIRTAACQHWTVLEIQKHRVISLVTGINPPDTAQRLVMIILMMMMMMSVLASSAAVLRQPSPKRPIPVTHILSTLMTSNLHHSVCSPALNLR